MPEQLKQIDITFTRALPKCELHAHLTGSISRGCLHDIWIHKQRQDDGLIDVVSFFPIFDSYIYNLCNDVSSVKYATQMVLEDFERDGVRYLELRTTPRGNSSTGMTPQSYVAAVCEAIVTWNTKHGASMNVLLVLSVDRKMTSAEAEEVVDLAIHHQHRPSYAPSAGNCVVALDLCGNPIKGDPSIFTGAMVRAKANGLGLTVHFAEVPQSSSASELETLLSWRPDRLGHAIHIPTQLKQVIRDRRLPLELCLSCNVLAKLTKGGFATHHFREWYTSECPVALSTDDVSIFDSPLSHEYLLAAEHFGLGSRELIQLSRDAAGAAFTGHERMQALIDEFQESRLYGA